MKLKCALFGHRRLELKAINGADIIQISDQLGKHLIAINVCRNCGTVYSDLFEKN